MLTAVQSATLHGMPSTALRDASDARPTVAEEWIGPSSSPLVESERN